MLRPAGLRNSRDFIRLSSGLFNRGQGAGSRCRLADQRRAFKNGAAFADPLSKPHWNGWGVDPSQHRFQPSDMARLDRKRRAAPETEVGVRLPRRDPLGRAADDCRRAGVCRQPRTGKSIRSMPRADAHIGSSTRARPFGRPSSSVHTATVGRRISATGRERPFGRRADRQGAVDDKSRGPPRSGHHRCADAGRDDAVCAGLFL